MKRRNIIVYSSLILIILLIVLGFILGNKSADDSSFISKENTDDYVVEKLSDGFVTFNGEQVICYGLDMEQKWVLPIDEKNAEMFEDNGYILIVSKENNNVYGIKNGEIKIKYQSEKPIHMASVNENGYLTVLTQNKGYKGECLVIDKGGNEVAKYSFGKKYIVSAHLASDNRYLIMNVIEEDEYKSKGKLIFTDIKKGEIINEIEKDKFITYTELSGDKLITVTDDSLTLYTKKGKEKWTYNFNGKNAIHIGVTNSYISLVVDSLDSFLGNEILTFTKNGKLKGRYVSETSVNVFDFADGYVAFTDNGEIALINKKGKLVDKVSCDYNVTKIKLFDGARKVLSISTTATMQSFGR